MVSAVRKAFNENFTQEAYNAYVKQLNERYNYEIEFRIAETPIFIPKALKQRMLKASDAIIDVLKRSDYKQITKKAVPASCNVPSEDAHTQFLAIDFAICRDAEGHLTPKLIELQGFPSLFGFQEVIAEVALDNFDIPDNFSYLFSGLTSDSYKTLLKDVICGKYQPENVVLLEIEPEKQKTKVDFYATQEFTGVKALCLTKVILEGRKLFYINDEGVKTPILRIYNRVIFDELLSRTDLQLQFNLTQPIDAEWAGHPNWFFKISKFTLPFIKSEYVPETHFLSDLDTVPSDLENWVLKPLFSFAGSGVIYNVTEEDILAISDRENYILMRKVYYADAVETPDTPAKAEIRMLFLWPEEASNPMLCTTLVRMSKGVMMGVKFNKDQTWVGGSVAFFEKD